MRFKVSYEVDVDLDGWAKARGIPTVEALSEALHYLRSVDAAQGQTFMTLVDDKVDAYFELLQRQA